MSEGLLADPLSGSRKLKPNPAQNNQSAAVTPPSRAISVRGRRGIGTRYSELRTRSGDHHDQLSAGWM